MSETDNELHSFAKQISTSSALSADEQHLPEDYGCGCGKCSFDSFFEKGCPKSIPSMSSFSYLNTKGLDDNVKQLLTGRLYNEFEVITTDFGNLVYKTCESLIKQGITVRELVRLLMTLGAFAFQPSLRETTVLQDCIEELQAADTIDKVFHILMFQGYTSFFSYHIIEYIIDTFGTEQDKENLHDYTAKLTEYSDVVFLNALHIQGPEKITLTLLLNLKVLTLRGTTCITWPHLSHVSPTLSKLQITHSGCVLWRKAVYN